MHFITYASNTDGRKTSFSETLYGQRLQVKRKECLGLIPEELHYLKIRQRKYVR